MKDAPIVVPQEESSFLNSEGEDISYHARNGLQIFDWKKSIYVSRGVSSWAWN